MVMGDMEMNTDLLVIGGGPAGYEAAFRAAASGLDVTLVDSFAEPGGNYLHRTSIPSAIAANLCSTLLQITSGSQLGVALRAVSVDLVGAAKHREKLIATLAKRLSMRLQEHSILYIKGRATFKDDEHVRIKEGEINSIRFKNALIATGSQPKHLVENLAPPGNRILTPASALKLERIPETLLVIGGGPTGLEIASQYAELGSRVTLVEKNTKLLDYQIGQEIAEEFLNHLKQKFASMYLGTEITSIVEREDTVTVKLPGADSSETEANFDIAVLAIGHKPNLDELGLDKTLVELNSDGTIKTNSRQQTTSPSIYSAGDACGTPMLASKAALQGKIAADSICGIPNEYGSQLFQTVLNTSPQLGWCGMSESEGKVLNLSLISQSCSWEDVDHSHVGQQVFGITKLLSDPDGRLVGGVVLGSGIDKLLGEITHAIEMGALVEDLALTLHPYGSTAETLAVTAQKLMDKISS
jgi:dihydrolipoamide dehydrogenase